jgi:hypothetical protein
MRLTFALGMNPYQIILMNDLKAPNILVSFAYSKILADITYHPEYLILDSGAFTAWNTGKQVDIDAYATWALANQHKAKKVVAVNLDVIPGEAGRTSTKKERIEGMKQSLINADYLRSKGLEVMEVYHQDEPQVFLDTLLDRLPVGSILGISPRNDVSLKSRIEWQNLVLRHLYQRYGFENLPKTHGLAVTALDSMKAFPYYSVDSSTWTTSMRFGQYITEWGKAKKLDEIIPKSGELNSKEAVLVGLRKSVESYAHVGTGITSLWEQRGVKWKD